MFLILFISLCNCIHATSVCFTLHFPDGECGRLFFPKVAALISSIHMLFYTCHCSIRRWSLIFLPWSLGKRVTASTRVQQKWCYITLKLGQKRSCSFCLILWSIYTWSPELLCSKSYYSEAARLWGSQATREDTWRHSGQQSWSRSHQVLSSSSSFWVFLAEVPDIVEQKLVTPLCPFQIPDSQNSHS